MESYLEAKFEGNMLPAPCVNLSDWESIVYKLGHVNKLRELRSKLHSKNLPELRPVLNPR